MKSPNHDNKYSLKKIAIAFEQLLADGKIREAFDNYTSQDFRHHNPFYGSDRESLILGMQKNTPNFKNKTYEVQRVLEDEDLVAIHSRLKPKPDWSDMSVVRIYRFEDDKIVEQWDVAQQAPDDSPNKNGLF